MKHIFNICIVILWTLASGAVGAQEPQQEGHSSYSGPVDAITLANLEQSRVRGHQADLLRRQALEALKKNETAKAERLFKQALDFDPDDGQSRIHLAYIHIRSKQPKAVIADLGPIVYPRPNYYTSIGSEITTRMMYVLAELDLGNWAEAVDCYEGSSRPGLTWILPGGGPVHTFPNLHFSTDTPDYSGLSAQAHLILGSRVPLLVEEQDRPQYMLDHLRQTLRNNPNSLDATYLSGFMLAKMERFTEARTAFDKAMRLAPTETRPEVQQALQTLKSQENTKLANDARVKAKR